MAHTKQTKTKTMQEINLIVRNLTIIDFGLHVVIFPPGWPCFNVDSTPDDWSFFLGGDYGQRALSMLVLASFQMMSLSTSAFHSSSGHSNLNSIGKTGQKPKIILKRRKFCWQLDPVIERGDRWGEKTVTFYGTIDGKGGQSIYQHAIFLFR